VIRSSNMYLNLLSTVTIAIGTAIAFGTKMPACGSVVKVTGTEARP